MKVKQGQPGPPAPALAVCLAGLFFLLAMGVALLGNLYRAVAADADENGTHRTALSCVVNQLAGGGSSGRPVGESLRAFPPRTTERWRTARCISPSSTATTASSGNSYGGGAPDSHPRTAPPSCPGFAGLRPE